MIYPRVMIAAPHGRSGKTTVSIGIVAALAARGLAVQPFKKGPDYIDPSWLTGACGWPCRNLDLVMMGEEATLRTFLRGANGADVSVIEGAMGFYDGLDLEGTGSSAAVARLLRVPVLLVVDATRMTRSVAALVSGYQHFEPGVNVAGVILNNVGRPRHEQILVGAVEHYCGIPVVGSIPKRQDLTIPDRHLGLVPKDEDEGLVPAIVAARRAVEEHLNLDLLLEIARSAPDLDDGERTDETGRQGDVGTEGTSPKAHQSSIVTRHSPIPDPRPPTPVARIGVLRDRVFTFYYPENFEALEAAGAELVYIDSIADRSLPEVDALYIGGGFPEVFMEDLEANEMLRRQIRKQAQMGMPVYAECAGLIYLSNRVRWGERQAEMVGALPCEVEMTTKPQGHGYAIAEVVEENPFFPVGQELRGHEFHNTRISRLDLRGARFAYRLSKGAGIEGKSDGLLIGNVLASYTHLHASAVPVWAKRFVEAATRHRDRI